MADLVAIGTGLLSAAGTWGLVDTASKLVSTNTGQTALTTGNLDSSTFVPAANALIGVCIRLSSRAAGSPATTITITLRNSTAGTNAQSVTANVSALPPATTGASSEGGWHFFKFAATETPNGTDSYLIRATLSATTIAVGLCTNGTANNWQRLLVRSTTQAPTTGDDLYLAQLLDGAANPATPTALAVTMDSTTATDYGSAVTGSYQAALSVSKGCTLLYASVAATNYILRLSGSLAVYSGGILTIGSVATPIPRGGTAVLEFDCAASSDFGLSVWNGATCTMQGLSRTSGKNFVWTLLTVNLAAAGTSATVADDTGWLNGDVLAIASTTRTPTECETVTLNADATATGLAWTGGVAAAHAGSLTEPMQAEVILLTRNVMFRSTLSTAYTYCWVDTTATVDLDWVDFRYVGTSSVQRSGIGINTGTGGSCTVSYCCIRDTGILGIQVGGNTPGTGVVTIEHVVGWRLGITATLDAGLLRTIYTGSSPAPFHTFNDLVAVYGVGSVNYLFWFANLDVPTITNIRVACASYYGLKMDPGLPTDMETKAFGPFHIHGCGNPGLYFTGTFINATFGLIQAWRNTSYGIDIAAQMVNCVFTQVKAWGNGTCNIMVEGDGRSSLVTFGDLQLASDSAFSAGAGLQFASAIMMGEFRILKGDFGTASGVKIAHPSSDFNLGLGGITRLWANNCLFTGASLFASNYYGRPGSVFGFSRFNRTAGSHRTYTPFGSVIIDTTTFDVTPSLKMTPLSATMRLESAAGVRGRGFLVPVDSGQTVTVTVKVRKDGTYNGSAPRLMVAANSGLGIDTDTVGLTHSTAANSWETMSYTTPAATDAGVFEFFVDCNGTAGNVFLDSWTAA